MGDLSGSKFGRKMMHSMKLAIVLHVAIKIGAPECGYTEYWLLMVYLFCHEYIMEYTMAAIYVGV